MIEINLLPAEFRPRDKTNLPLMLTVAVGMLIVGSTIMYGISLSNDLAGYERDRDDYAKRKEGLQEHVDRKKDLDAQIANQEKRQRTIISISQTKIMWSLKLEQLAKIMERYPDFWIKQLRIAKAGKGKDALGNPIMGLRMECSVKNGDLEQVAKFRDALQDDPNFYYHFDKLRSLRTVRTPLQGYDAAHTFDFELELPLRTLTEDQLGGGGGKKKKKK